MTIRSFTDVEREMRLLKDELDKLRSKNLDLNGRRVINAGSAREGTDYTTKDDVLSLLNFNTTKEKIEPGNLQIDISIAIPETGTDVSLRPVVWIPYNYKGTPILCGARLKEAPTGGAFSLRWNHYSKFNDNTVNLFGTTLLTIPEGSTYGTVTKFYPNRTISSQDYFTLDIIGVNEASGLYTFLAINVD